MRESVWAVLIVWVPPALPSICATSCFVHAVSPRGTNSLLPQEAVVT
jgi:hypothetical protein